MGPAGPANRVENERTGFSRSQMSVYFCSAPVAASGAAAVSKKTLAILRDIPGYHCRVLKRAGAVLGKFDRRVWLLLVAMLVFRFGQGLYYPFSTIYFHNFVGIPLSLVGVGLAALAASSV
ncbi:MAG: hypothetical protein M3426_15815, partial [Actinomycetota bacterium]|nr:hypothetical protein [Actinomycetota bacterium]